MVDLASQEFAFFMEEIDALGRQMLIERPCLTRGRLSVFRLGDNGDEWFPRLNITIKRAGSDQILWQWTSHTEPIDFDEPPPYGEELLLEKYFELASPVKSPRGVEAVLSVGQGATLRGRVEQFSVSLYLYPLSLEDRGIQLSVVDFVGGLTTAAVPLYFRVNFPW